MKKLIVIFLAISMCSIFIGCIGSNPQYDNELLLEYSEEYIATSITYLNELSLYVLDDNAIARGYCDSLIQLSNDMDDQISGLKTNGDYTLLKNEIYNLTDDIAMGCNDLKIGLINLDFGDIDKATLGIDSFNHYSVLMEEHIDNCLEIIDRING